MALAQEMKETRRYYKQYIESKFLTIGTHNNISSHKQQNGKHYRFHFYYQPRKQADFRAVFDTNDHFLVMTVLIDKSIESNRPLIQSSKQVSL